MPHFIRIGGHSAEIIGGGYAVNVPALGIFVNDSDHGPQPESLTERDRAAMLSRVMRKARAAVRKAHKLEAQKKGN